MGRTVRLTLNQVEVVTMPDASYLSMYGARAEAEAGQTALANSVLHLFKYGFTPTLTTPLSEFLSNECDYDGYAAKTIATWGELVLAGLAYAIYPPTQTFQWEHDTDDVSNAVGGAFLVTASGDLYQYTIFDPIRQMGGPDQAVIMQPTDIYPAG